MSDAGKIRRLVLTAKEVEARLPPNLKLVLASKRLQRIAQNSSKDKTSESSKQVKSPKPKDPLAYGEVRSAADYPWNQCMDDAMKEYGDKDTAQKVCGSIKAKNGKKKLNFLAAANFEESKHPRASDGKFTSGGGSPKSEGGSKGKTNKKETKSKSVKGDASQGGEFGRISKLVSKHIDGKVTDIDERTEDGSRIIKTDSGAEYRQYEDPAAAREAARESLRNLYDDLGPEGWNKDFVASHTDISDTDKRQIANDLTDSYTESYNDSDDKEGMETPEEYFDRVSKSLEEDPKGFLVDEEGLYSEEDYYKAPFVQVDEDALIEDSIETDGIGHTLATYDGEETELPDGSLMYRVN